MNSETKTTLKNTLFSALVFSIIFGVYQAVKYDFAHAILLAPLAGFIFGLFIFVFLRWQLRTLAKDATVIAQNEKIIYAGLANRIKNFEAIGGKLLLLEDRLAFTAHKLNIQQESLIVHFSQIQSVEFYSTFKIIPNGLKLKFRDGYVEKFVLNNRKFWASEITSRL
ncbi:hypothetical protein ACJVDH_14365 [Pedobacter sp. AW1-32]|uniref:hypothetical protein n=1 Tax=Pedobacter sp. AW1-32 TaxID=3383026 RepID=UPI003FF11AC3